MKQKTPINCDNNKCYICNFPIKINTKRPNVPNPEMSYTDFYRRYEHIFLRDIYSKEELESSDQLKTSENYKKIFHKFLIIIILTACSCHVTYAFKSESTLGICLNVKEVLARNRRNIRSLSDCNWTRIHNHLVRKRTLNHLAKLAK